MLHRLKQLGFGVNRRSVPITAKKRFFPRKIGRATVITVIIGFWSTSHYQVEIILGVSIGSGNSGYLKKNIYIVKKLRSLAMKIIKSRAGALTNFEVLDLLRSRGAGKDPTRVIASVSQSEFKVFDYLEQTAAHSQTRGVIHKLVEDCKKYGLAKAEILNIANIRPSSAVEVYTMIEECETRMEDRVDELMETIVQVLPPHPSQVEFNKEIVEAKS